jgi:hypothetical protein
MSDVRGRTAAPRTKLRNGFDLNQRRRIEIERHAIHIGAAETEDLCRWLIAWVWHNPGAKDQVGAVSNALVVLGAMTCRHVSGATCNAPLRFTRSPYSTAEM